jgi:hypothetical protein
MKPEIYRYSTFAQRYINKHPLSVMRNYVEFIHNKIIAGVVFDADTLADYQRYSKVIKDNN